MIVSSCTFGSLFALVSSNRSMQLMTRTNKLGQSISLIWVIVSLTCFNLSVWSSLLKPLVSTIWILAPAFLLKSFPYIEASEAPSTSSKATKEALRSLIFIYTSISLPRRALAMDVLPHPCSPINAMRTAWVFLVAALFMSFNRALSFISFAPLNSYSLFYQWTLLSD